MRILTNIANEYSQYRKKLYDPNKKNLNLTKLLAMIVYKNYFPKDFAQLHRRDGDVYKCLSSKRVFVKEALKVLDTKTKQLEEKKKRIEENEHLKESDLRYLFLQELREAVYVSMSSIQIDNQYYTLRQISQNENLFDKLSKLSSIRYQYFSYGSAYNQSANVSFDSIDKKIKFKERIEAIKTAGKVIQKEEKELHKEELKIQSQKLSHLLKAYNLGDSELYRGFSLAPLMDVFIRQGYIDEDYYDYISYFYPGMVSLADRDLLLSMKRQIKKEYTYHIDKINNFVKELKPYMFEHDAILNNDLLDYLAPKNNAKERDMFAQMMGRLEKADAPLGFLAQYYQLGKQKEKVFSEFIKWNTDQSWQMIEAHSNTEEQQLLREGWLKYCDEVTEMQSLWLNENYSFLSSRVENIGLEKCKKLIKGCLFTDIDDNSEELLSEVIEQWHYDVSTKNLCFIVNFLNKDSGTDANNLNLTRITDTHHPELENYVKHAFIDAFTCFSANCKDESVENILYILNHKDLKPEQKIPYLNSQINLLDDFTNVNENSWNIAIKSKIIAPTWENIDCYFNKNGGVTDELLSYIEYYYAELEDECSDDIESKGTLFNELLGSSKLSLKAYRSISKAFNNKFDGFEKLGQLDRERLLILLADDKIAFSEANIVILQKMAIYPEYLIHYHDDFLNNLGYTYNIGVNDALTLLNSEKFSLQEKRRIVGILSSKVITGTKIIADKIIEILLSANDILIGQDVLSELLSMAENENNKVAIASQMLSNYKYNNDGISALLNSLGGIYVEIAERRKRPILENSAGNVALLSRLKDLGFISSTTPEKDGIKVNPKRK